MLLIEAKKIPVNIELVNMRSYGDKPQSFLRKVPNGMLPALEDNASGNVALDSAYIMEFLEDYSNRDANSKSNHVGNMIPDRQTQPEEYRRYTSLMGLERELFRWWCTFMFRPEQPNIMGGGAGGGVAGLVGNLFGGNAEGNDDDSYVSPSMKGFLDCLETVDAQLGATNGPYFLDSSASGSNHPTMIDFVYASHVERMLASCAYWKGMNLRDPNDYPTLSNLRKWMDALEQHEYYLAFKSDYYTHVKDIPPQYGPGCNGVSRSKKIQSYKAMIEGDSSTQSWKLPLEDDDSLQPLFRGIPLPLCVLEAADIRPDAQSGSYESTAKTSQAFRTACQTMAAWKLCGNGSAVSRFASRGGPSGSKNFNRKTFGAELADPYAAPDEGVLESVDALLRVVSRTMLVVEANTVPSQDHADALVEAAASHGGASVDGMVSSLAYLRDRIGVPRDLPLASARYLRAYLNWAIDVLEEK